MALVAINDTIPEKNLIMGILKNMFITINKAILSTVYTKPVNTIIQLLKNSFEVFLSVLLFTKSKSFRIFKFITPHS